MAFAGAADAQIAYPPRPIRVIVPQAPGGTVDLLTRVLAERPKDVRLGDHGDDILAAVDRRQPAEALSTINCAASISMSMRRSPPPPLFR